MQLIASFTRALIAFTLVASLYGGAWGQPVTVGVQAIGLAAWHPNDVQLLSSLLVQAGGDVQVAYLPFEFTLNQAPYNDPWQDPPFVRARELVMATLPAIRGTLTLTTHLYFRHNGDNYQAAFRWTAFERRLDGSFTNNRPADREFRDHYAQRCLRNAQFLNALYAWAWRNGLAPKLGLVTVPELEDDAPSRDHFKSVQQFIVDTYASVGASTQYRRSGPSRSPGVPLEGHGRTIDGLLRGDTYSNDGDCVQIPSGGTCDRYLTWQQYLDRQRSALANGVSVLFWRSTYNGYTGERQDSPYPFLRGTLTPLTGPHGQAEQAAIAQVLRAR